MKNEVENTLGLGGYFTQTYAFKLFSQDVATTFSVPILAPDSATATLEILDKKSNSLGSLTLEQFTQVATIMHQSLTLKELIEGEDGATSIKFDASGILVTCVNVSSGMMSKLKPYIVIELQNVPLEIELSNASVSEITELGESILGIQTELSQQVKKFKG